MSFAAVAAGVGVGMQAYGQYKVGQVEKAAFKSEAAWHAYNAEIAGREAEAVREEALYEEKAHRRMGERLKARQRVMFSAKGLTLENTPAMIIEETAAELEMDAFAIRRTGALQAGRWRSRGVLDLMAGRAAKTRGRYAGRMGTMRAGTTLLAGSSDIWAKKRTGYYG